MNSSAQVSPIPTPAMPRHPEHHTDYPILSISGLTVAYESGLALEDVSFTLNTGERMAVVGPNGAGKSTLFKVIAGLLKPEKGLVNIYGEAPNMHNCIAYLPQHAHVDWNFPVTVSDVVMMGRTQKIGFLRWATGRDRKVVANALDTVGLGDFSKRQISQLSGGQQQRMFIARALAQEADLMLLDEPVTGLDTPSQEELFTVLDSLRQQQVTVMIALHDLQLAATSFDRALLLNRRLIGIGAPAEVFTTEMLSQAYGDKSQVNFEGRTLSGIDNSCCGEEEESNA